MSDIECSTLCKHRLLTVKHKLYRYMLTGQAAAERYFFLDRFQHVRLFPTLTEQLLQLNKTER